MWQVSEQDFNVEGVGPGRIVVPLGGDLYLSVITSERNAYIRENKMWSPSAMAGGGGWEQDHAEAEADEYEVACVDGNTQYIVPLNPVPEGWAEHEFENDGDTLYGHITSAMLNDFINERVKED